VFTQSFAALGDGVCQAYGPGDLNHDGEVDSADLGLLLLYYGPCEDGCGGADLDGSGDVDSGDLGILLLYYS
jgi:hypothetical protein